MSCREMCLYSFFHWSGYFWHAWMSFVATEEFSMRVTKITSRFNISLTHSLPFCSNLFLTQWIMAILSKRCKPDNFEEHNSLKLSFKIFEVFVPFLLNVNLSLNQTLLIFLLYVSQTWITQMILTIFLWGVIFL